MKKLFALLTACLFSTSALAQSSETFSTYITGLAPASSVIGTERMFALQSGSPKTMTPYQILSNVTGDCTFATPPTIVCTKINGVTLAASATTNTTNAANISSGLLPLARLALTNTQIYVGNVSNIPVSVALSGDCTISNLGAVTCTKTGGATFAASATSDTTNATNISSGTLAAARMTQVNLAASGAGGVGGVLPFANHPSGLQDTIVGYFSSITMSAISVPNCAGALQYSTTTHVFACGAGGGTVNPTGSPTSGQIAVWTNGTTIQGQAITALATINVIKTQTFSSSGTYTPSTGLQYAIYECVGGGGAGGGSTGAAQLLINGGGGGGGAYARGVSSAATIGGSQTVSIGNGGTGASGSNGGNGGATSIGSLCIGGGGSGGTVATASAVGLGGQGGIATAGNTLVTSGGVGQSGVWVNNAPGSTIVQGPSGAGGNSIWGGGGVGVSGGDPSATNGVAGLIYGGGGSGGQTNDDAVNVTGGNGANGYVIITEFTRI